MESPRRLLLVFAIVCSAVAVPLSKKEKCARQCTESRRFQFTPGKTYTYEYETLTTTTVKGTSEETSQLQMKAQVDIEILSKCDFSLRLRDVALKQSDPQNPGYLNPVKGGHRFARTAEKYILRFSYQDGVVEDICPDEEAPSWVTNIQRGILSSFQNSMTNLEGSERLIETDVAGKCSVDYQSLGRSWRGTLTIRKSKDLNSCTHRHSADTSFQAAPFNHGPAAQSMPIVRGHQECELSIGKDILQSSSCTETHVLRPFSKGSGGATTTVNQRLIYVSSSRKSFTGDDYRPTRANLLFDHGQEPDNSGKSEEEAERALAKLCQASSQEMGIAVPGLFASFVYRMKQLDYETFRSLYRRVDTVCPNNPKAKKFFLDAVPVVSTLSSVKFMAESINRREVSQSEIDFWFTSLSFISEPTAEMIAALTPLLDGTHDQAFFGVSSLVHTFCKSHDCSKVQEVRAVVHQLSDFLGEYCLNSDVRKILLTLKSIGNIGLPFGREKVLERCAMNPQLETEVRIAAIQAFRRFSCDVSRETFLKMYGNYNEGSEMRTAAYISVMVCPTPDTLQTVKHTLEEEQVNQVGSFVWTHLRAFSKSQHPSHQNIKDILSTLYLLNKYESDIRKFSSAKEASFYLDSIDSGFHVDTHLIYPTHSYLPHSAMFNLTVDVFGHSCNLLQLDGRLEGLERTVEWFFGPDGVFPQKQVSKLLRDKRSVSDNKIERMEKDFDVKSKFDKMPYGSLDVKIFGNTMWYSQFQEGDRSATSSTLMDFVSQLATKQEKEFSRSFMFMDTNFAIPTATGLPLRLSLNGTATVGLKMSGKFNVRSFKNVDILANLEPSGAVELAGLLTVDAGGVTRTGMRIAATIHSSTVLDSSLEVRNGQLVNAKINMPREKIEIIDVQSKLYLVYGSEEREQEGPRDKDNHFNTCTGDLSRRLLGVELCADVSLPKGHRNSPMYPMSGAAMFSLFLRKTDPTLTAYTFDASWESKTVGGKSVRNALISFDTPKSTIDREVSAQFHLSEQDNAMSLVVKSPLKKLALRAKYVNGKDHSKIDLSATVDDTDTFVTKAELRIVDEDGGISYFPSLEIQVPSRKLLSVAGSAHLRHGLKYGGQLTIKELTVRPIILKGNLDVKNRDRYEGSISISSFGLDSTTKASMQMGNAMFVKLNTDYSIMEGKQYKVNINGKIRDLSANALTKYTGVLSMQATAFPEWDTSVSWESMMTKGHLENTLSMAVGDGTRSRVHTINVQEIVRYKGDLMDNSLETTLKFSYPERGWNYGVVMKHENTDRTLKNEMEIQYAKNRKVNTLVNLNLHEKNTIDFSGDFHLQYPGRNMKLSTEVRQNNPRDYRGSLTMQWQEGKNVEVITHYKNRGEGGNTKYEADAEIKFSYRPSITFSSSVGNQRGQYAGFAELSVGLDKYRVSAEYTKGQGFSHRLMGQVLYGSELYVTNALAVLAGEKFTGSAELKLPSLRRITAKVVTKNGETTKSLEVESLWDADRDPTQRFGLASEFHLKNNGCDGTMNMQIRKRRIRFFLTAVRDGELFGRYLRSLYKTEIQWSPKDRITATLDTNIVRNDNRHELSTTLDVSTLYAGYESISVAIKHGAGNRQWSSEATGTLSNSKVIKLSTDGKYTISRSGGSLEASVQFTSPFRMYESVSFNATHFQNSWEFSNKMQLLWNRNNRITTNVYNSLISSGFKSAFSVITPFSTLSDVSMEVVHNYASGSYKTNGVLQWSPSNKISTEMELRHLLSSRQRICSLNIAVNTPFKDYESLSSKFSYNNDGTTINADVEAQYGRVKKLTAGLMSSFQNSYYNKNLDAKLYFTSPFANFENLQAITAFKSSSESYELNLDANGPYQKSLSFNSVGKLPSWRNIELNVVLSGYLPVYENQRLSFDLVHRVQNSNLRSTLDLASGRKQVTVIVSGVTRPGYKSEELEGSLSVKSPFRGYEEIKLDAIHKQRDGEYMTRVQGNRNSIRALLVHNMNVKDAMNLESNFHFTSTLRGYEDIKATLSQIYNPGYFTHATKLQWSQSDAVELNAQYQSKISFREFTLNLDTPFDQVKSLAVSAEHQTANMEYKSKLTTHWNRRKVITFESSVSNYRWQTVEAEVRHVNHFSSRRSYQFTGKYDITSPQKTVSLKYLWNHGVDKAISLNGNVQVSRQSPKFDVTARTPYRGYETITVIGTCENRPFKKHLSLKYEKNTQKVVATADLQLLDDGLQYEMSFSSPYKNAERLSFFGKYHKGAGDISGDIDMEWAQEKKISFTGVASYRESHGETKITINTPFVAYDSLSLDSSIDISKRKSNANAVIRWGNENKIEFSADCEVKKGREGNFGIQFSSPFDILKELNAASNYRISSEGFTGEIDVGVDRKWSYNGKVSYNQDGSFNLEVQTPHRPFRNVVLNVALIRNMGHQEVQSYVQWEERKIEVGLLYKNLQNRQVEVKLNLNTPFRNFKKLQIEGDLRNEDYQNIDGKLTVRTPFESLPNLEVSASLKSEEDVYSGLIKMTTPSKAVTLSGQVSNSLSSPPLVASLDVDVPFTSYKHFAVRATTDMKRKAEISFTTPRSKHSIIVSFHNDNKRVEAELTIESPFLRRGKCKAVMKANFEDPSRFQMNAVAEIFGERHTVAGTYRRQRRDHDIEVTMFTPLVTGEKVELKCTYTERRQRRSVDAKLGYLEDIHEFKSTYENDAQATALGVTIESSALPSGSFKGNAKYVNGNSRDLEFSLNLETPESKHAVVASVKNYDGEKFLQLKVECPILYSRHISLTGTLKYEQLNAIDGALTVTFPTKEVRIAVNMKRKGWENVEGFLTLNTPFEDLKMLRIDAAYKNYRFKNIEWNVQMESSNRNYPSVSLLVKLSRMPGSEDISLNLRLPNTNYQIQALGTMHYNPEKTMGDARLTLSLSPKQYSIYGRYALGDSELAMDGEFEWNNKKWTAVGNVDLQSEFKGLSLLLTMPDRTSYEAGCSFTYNGKKHNLALSYRSPRQEAIRVNTSVEYVSLSNVGFSMNAVTPLHGYRNIDVVFKHHKTSNERIFTNAEVAINSKRGLFNFYHRTNGTNFYITTLTLRSPFQILRNAEISLTNNQGRDKSLDITYNNEKKIRAEVVTVRSVRTAKLEFPTIPFTLLAKLRPRDGGHGITLKSNYPTRMMTLNLGYHILPGFIANEGSFIWDESTGKAITYNAKITDVGEGQSGKELFCLLTFPRRSFELRGRVTRSGRVQSGGIDFYWDAMRNLKKNISFGIEHQDVSTRQQIWHKLQMTLTHPALSRELVQRNELLIKPKEFVVKSELHYSRDNQHHFVAEVTGNDLSRNGKDTNYKMEVGLRHLVSHLDLRMAGELTNNREESFAHLRLNSADRTGQQSVREIKAKILKLRKEIDILMRSGSNHMSVLGKMAQRGNDLEMSLDHKVNDRKGFQSQFRFNQQKKSLELDVTYEERKGVFLSASFPEDSASLKLAHTSSGNTVTDGFVYVGLEKSRILKSRVNWRPRMWRDLRIATGETLRSLSHSLNKELSEAAKEFYLEWQDKTEAASRALNQQIAPFQASIRQDFDALKDDAYAVYSYMAQMVRNNEFFILDIVQGIKEGYQSFRNFCDLVALGFEAFSNVVFEWLEELYDVLYVCFEDMSAFLHQKYLEMKSSASKVVRLMAERMSDVTRAVHRATVRVVHCVAMALGDVIEKAGRKLEDWVRSYAPCIIDMYYSVRMRADKFRENVKTLFNNIANSVTSHPLYVALAEYWSEVVATVEAFQLSDITTSVQSRVLFLGEKAGAFMNRLSDGQLIDIIRNRLPIDYVASAAKVSLKKGADLYGALGIDKLVNILVNYAWEHFKETALSSGHEMLHQFYLLRNGAKYDYDPKQGLFAFEYTLPTTTNSIYDIFNFAQYFDYQKIAEVKNALVSRYYEDFCIWDIYYRVKKFFSPRQWMPPFTAHAMVAGNQHYVTFDKFAFDFAGECSYLLARDFVDGNFTVIANYKREGSKAMKKSLTILVGSTKVEVAHDYKVTLDDVKVELPIKVGDTVAIREGSTVRIENGRAGISVVCNFVYDVCTVGVSGFYFGKTGGLFGTYDYEPKLDLMTPDMNIASDIESFANSWEVGQATCRRAENMATIPGNDYRVQEKCRDLFAKTSSNFRACFKQVDPEPYLRMCVSDLSAVDESKLDSAMCVSAAAYFTECKIEGVQLKMPKSCVRCERDEGSPMTEGDVSKYRRDRLPRSADVVYIVEEKKCNKENYKYLEKLAFSMEDHLRQQGFLEVRHRVVGFGGDDVHSDPHVHTIDGKEYGSARSIESAFKSLQVGNGPSNMLEALRFAASLSYHPGSAKSFILMKCSTCEAEENRVAYGEVLRTLMDGEISLHLLMEQKYEMKIARNSKAKKVIGLDKNFAYTLKDIKDSSLLGDGDLLFQLKMPKDICVPLALEVNGSTFDSQYMTETKRNVNKKFMDVFSRRVTMSAKHRSEWTMCCECIATTEGVGKATCQKCVSTEVANMISGDTITFSAPESRRTESRSKVRKPREKKQGGH